MDEIYSVKFKSSLISVYILVIDIVCLQMMNQTMSFFMFLLHMKNEREEENQK
jgi:hypothetical protein